MELPILIIVGVLATALGIAIGRYVWPAIHKGAIAEAKMAGEEVARLSERASGLTKQIEEQTKQHNALITQRDGFANEAKTAGAEVARLTERESALTQRIDMQAVQLAEQQKQLTGPNPLVQALPFRARL